MILEFVLLVCQSKKLKGLFLNHCYKAYGAWHAKFTIAIINFHVIFHILKTKILCMLSSFKIPKLRFEESSWGYHFDNSISWFMIYLLSCNYFIMISLPKMAYSMCKELAKHFSWRYRFILFLYSFFMIFTKNWLLTLFVPLLLRIVMYQYHGSSRSAV